MSDVVPISRGMVLGSYIAAQNNERTSEEVFFVGGLILALVLPPAGLYFAYGGLALLALASAALLGALWGEVGYYRNARQGTPRIFMGMIPQAPLDKAVRLKDAA